MDRPQAPEAMAAQPLRFERAEHDPAVLENDRMQRHAEIEIADAIYVGLPHPRPLSRRARGVWVVHDEKLQSERVRGGTGGGRLEGVAIADEDDLARSEEHTSEL